jgi:hypothetical protein
MLHGPLMRHPQVGFPTRLDAIQQTTDYVLPEELDEVRGDLAFQVSGGSES